ncbi:hypothetical protein TGAM01_v208062 [Trichoderma gamsii]|uniref:Peptidase S8/S53 domain-containing protein n=1 Tax=Trichoderma gamsii TaxID=398673 RepID=A0A2P4ZFJ7_9HYPO|nr:hypothetical protein TGAM01_v208062 [Trichoderma gamsii]PON23057.1 hypothetical protein TGAM01_v208062 [Trichoderma gamsii]
MENDTLVKTAIEENDRIMECCGFVSDRESLPDSLDYEDFDGHGTHVTRLILKAAPSAEIFIAKISNGRNIEPQRLDIIARRGDGVLAIHASDGLGNDGGISPTPMKNRENFSTLGIAIPSKWKKQAVDISGTSYATPIAASFAANMLELARCKVDLSEHQQNMLRKYNGVRQILQLMVGKDIQPRGGYDYIVPEINNKLEERSRLLIDEMFN